MSDSLDKLVRESRQELGTREAREVDWAKVEQGLFQRIEVEQRDERAKLVSGRGGRWTLVASGLALAATVAVVVGTPRRSLSIDGSQTANDDSAGNVIAVEGGGQLLVDGQSVGVGTALHVGDVIEARTAQATVERPGKLTMIFERGARATVTHVQGALVLALEEGAVEAQVVPVASGEAFAIDVGGSRVAVHGTHLRVARAGEHVVLDLSEGVVLLGEAPRMGSTAGVLVTAPAHAEFTASEAERTLSLTHDPAGVRMPLSLGPSSQPRGVPQTVALPLPVKADPGETRSPPGVSAAAHVEGHASGVAPKSVATVEVSPEAAIIAAVRSCLAERPRADNVTVVVSTTVRLAMGPDGAVSSARFDPPVAPDVNACASGAIYKQRFAHGGSVAIPVDLTLPSSAP
jgi:hypothetical protein